MMPQQPWWKGAVFDLWGVVTIRAGKTAQVYRPGYACEIKAITCPVLPTLPRVLRVGDAILDLRVLHAEAQRARSPQRLTFPLGIPRDAVLYFTLGDPDTMQAAPVDHDLDLHVYTVGIMGQG